MVAAAPGTDTGGSIRCPASCCGVVGLKPTYGRVSLAGVRPLCTSLDHCGPMARTVRDCALQLEALAGGPARDPRVAAVPVERWSEALCRRVAGMTGRRRRALLLRAHRARHRRPRARAAVDGAARTPGAEIVEVDLEWPTPLGEGDPFIPEEAATLAATGRPGARTSAPTSLATSRSPRGWGRSTSPQTNQYRLEYAGRMLDEAAAAGIDLIATPTQAQSPPHDRRRPDPVRRAIRTRTSPTRCAA